MCSICSFWREIFARESDKGQSILFSIGFVFPEFENTEGFGAEEIFHGDATCADFSLEFFVDKAIVKPARGRVGMRAAEIDTARPGPINCTEAHRAGFAGCVDNAIV